MLIDEDRSAISLFLYGLVRYIYCREHRLFANTDAYHMYCTQCDSNIYYPVKQKLLNLLVKAV